MPISGSSMISSDPIAECRQGLLRHAGFDNGPLFDACMRAALGESEGPSYGVLAGTLASSGDISDLLKGTTLFSRAVMHSSNHYYNFHPDQKSHHPAIFRFDETCRVRRELWSRIAEIGNFGAGDSSEQERLIRELTDKFPALKFDDPGIEHIGREALDLIFEADAIFAGAVLLSSLLADEDHVNIATSPQRILRNDVHVDIIEHSAQLLAGGMDEAMEFAWKRLKREWAHHAAFLKRLYAQRGILDDLPTLRDAKVPTWANWNLYAINGEGIDVILSAERFLGGAAGEVGHIIHGLFGRFDLVSSIVFEGAHLFRTDGTIATNAHLREAFVLAKALCRLDPNGSMRYVQSFFVNLALDDRLSIEDVSYLMARSEDILGSSEMERVKGILEERGLAPVGQSDWHIDAVGELNRYRCNGVMRLLRRVRDVRTDHGVRLVTIEKLGSLGREYGARYMIPLLEQIEESAPTAELVERYPCSAVIQQTHQLSSAARRALSRIRTS